MLQTGSVVDGKYKILSKIGQGGMSIVYMAINERANKTWAIKEIRRDGIKDYEVVKQGLIVETDLLKRLNHPNLPSIIDVIEEADSFLIVMDYIEGKPLSSALREYGAQDQNDVIKWAKQLCDVLGYLHSREPAIIYRDMKPSNVMLKPDGNIMLIDFGIAREFKKDSVADTTCLGTRGYAAPEQYGGHGQTDARTDIYCLGATMYHLLTGHNPSEPPYEMYPIRNWNPALSSGLEEIILKCTQQNPEDRFQSCAELMYALEHYNELDRTYRRKQGRRWLSFVAGAALTVVSGIGAIGFHIAEKNVRQSGYDQYVLRADSTDDQQEKFEYCQQAIAISPEGEETYQIMLKSFAQDGEFTSEEEEMFRTMMGTSEGKDRTNKEYLSVYNKEGYLLVCQEAAMLYFYYTSDSKSRAKEWLVELKSDEAQSSQSPLSESEKLRAKLLYDIADYYSNLGSVNKAGDSMKSYAEYWTDLIETVSEDIVENDNAVTALVVYQEMVTQIHKDYNKFKNAGVDDEEILAQLEYVGGQLEDLREYFKGDDNEELQYKLESVLEMIQVIKDKDMPASSETETVDQTTMENEGGA